MGVLWCTKNNIITFSDVEQRQITTLHNWTWKVIFTYLLTTDTDTRNDVETILVRLVSVVLSVSKII